MTFIDAAKPPPAGRRIFSNRTLNLRSIRAIGFDMDYTLIHYKTEEWERRAYDQVKRRFIERRWPVEGLEFDPQFATIGLVLDLELGNIVKANRFGYVKRACHGTRMLDFDEQRRVYSRVLVDLEEPRWVFINTLFALSETCIYAQTVDLLDEGRIHGLMSYTDLYRVVRASLDETHMEGELKSEIMAHPEQYAVVDAELPLCLLDLKHAGKKLLLITNSDWRYSRAMMQYAFDPHLPAGTAWRDLFDLVIVSARKPDFFTTRNPIFEVVDGDGLLRPSIGALQEGGVYLGGHAGHVERHLGLSGDEILYVGDHLFADVHVSKNVLRWRTALVLRELEAEIDALETFKPMQAQLTELMTEKESLESRYSQLRLALQRLENGYGPQPELSASQLREQMQRLRSELGSLDERIAPLARAGGELLNPRWGLLMRAGNDKSHLARQIERYADVYTSRVSNLLLHTPFVYLRSPRGSLPHDSGPAGGV